MYNIPYLLFVNLGMTYLRLPVTTVPFSFLAPLAGGLLTDSLDGVLKPNS
jgi:hypothetical protein